MKDFDGRILLLGNPNAGKTLLFNQLTGRHHQVANYPGVTVEVGQGSVKFPRAGNVEVLDLPGIYGLSPQTSDENIAIETLVRIYSDSEKPCVVLVVVDATHLDRHLYLVSQLVDLRLPLVVAMSMVDCLEADKIKLDLAALRDRMALPVVPICAYRKQGLPELMVALDEQLILKKPRAKEIKSLKSPESEIHYHYDRVAKWTAGVVEQRQIRAEVISDKIDRAVLHPVFGFFILIMIFAVMFQALFTWSQPAVALIEQSTSLASEWVRPLFFEHSLFGSLLTDGILAGVGSVIAFVPLIAVLFLFLGILEDTGYLARATFLLDRVMSRFGLPAKAFVPLVSGFACAVPAIMATRVIDSRRERLMTILVTPLMSCSARLPVYGLLIGAFFSQMPPIFGFVSPGAVVLLSLYVLGIVMALVCAALLNRYLVKGQSSTLILELPTYRMPRWSSLANNVWLRVRLFLKEAGTIIMAMTIIMWALFTFPRTEGLDAGAQLEQSYAGRLGKLVEPIIEPLGFNWKMGVGLVASFTAREVLVSTLGVVYGLGAEEDEKSPSLRQALAKDVSSPLTALSLMVFFALAMQCMSTLAVTRKETKSWRWPAFQFAFMTVLAWTCSFMVYQGGRFLGF